MNEKMFVLVTNGAVSVLMVFFIYIIVKDMIKISKTWKKRDDLLKNTYQSYESKMMYVGTDDADDNEVYGFEEKPTLSRDLLLAKQDAWKMDLDKNMEHIQTFREKNELEERDLEVNAIDNPSNIEFVSPDIDNYEYDIKRKGASYMTMLLGTTTIKKKPSTCEVDKRLKKLEDLLGTGTDDTTAPVGGTETA